MEIKYYSNSFGNSPILKYISTLIDKDHAASIFVDINLLADFGSGYLSRTADLGKVTGVKNLWELRTRCSGNIIYRTLFSIVGEDVVILNIFNKKEQKLKKQEINLALRRLNNLI